MFSDFNRAQSDKEGVKLLSVKTTSTETGECFLWVYVCFPVLVQRRAVFGMSCPIPSLTSVPVRSKSLQTIPLQSKPPDCDPVELQFSCTLCAVSIWE